MVDYDDYGAHTNGPQHIQFNQYQQQQDRYQENVNYYPYQNGYNPPSNSYYDDFSSSRYHESFESSVFNSGNAIFNKWLNNIYGDRMFPQFSFGWGVGVAIFVILFFHYRDYSKKIQEQEYYGMEETLTWHEHFLDYLEYLRLSVTSIFQTIYSLKFFIAAPSKIRNFRTKNNSSTLGDGKLLKRGVGLPKLSSKIPQLEEISESPSVTAGVFTGSDHNNDGEIAPAFLTEDEYPEGWLVFDTNLGKLTPFKGESRKSSPEEVVKNKMV